MYYTQSSAGASCPNQMRHLSRAMATEPPSQRASTILKGRVSQRTMNVSAGIAGPQPTPHIYFAVTSAGANIKPTLCY